MIEKQRNYNIIPGIGINLVRFGMIQDHVEKIMGQPDQKCYQKYGDILFDYDDICWLTFSAEDDFRLISIGVEIVPGVTINNKDMANKKLHEILELFPCHSTKIEKMGCGPEFIGTNIIVDELSLIIYCNEDNYGESILLSVYFDQNDEIIWPNIKREDV